MNLRNVLTIGTLTMLLAVGGCQKSEETAQDSPLPAGHPSVEATSGDATAPATGESPDAAQINFPLQGKVVEIHNGSGYSFILLDTPAGQHWIATMEIQAKVGDELGFADGNLMYNFPSKSLNRTFDEIIFSSSVIGGAAGGGHHQMPAGDNAGASGSDSFSQALQAEGGASGQTDVAAMDPSLQGSSKAIVPSTDTHVEKAAGANAYTVAELYEKASSLTGKTVILQAKVVKVSPNIMGKNWLHVQDGSGDPMKNTHDLVVTTAATPENGKIVTLEGTLNTNRDFGYGYLYAVLVEDAVIK